jgi:hypothetical protein
VSLLSTAGRFALALLAALAAALPALAQEGAPGVAHDNAQDEPLAGERTPASIESARERWQKLSPERQRELAERFQRWRSMSEEERAQMRDRYHWYERMRRSECDRLPESAKQSLERLDPERRCEAIHGLLSERISERGQAILDMLPPEWREKLEKASPEQRLRLVEEFRKRMRARSLEHIDDLARDGELSAGEAERLKGLEPAKLVGELVAVERRRIERRGPPWNVSAEQWEAWKGLSDRQFFEHWNEVRRRSCSRSERGRRRWCQEDPPKTPREAEVRELQLSLWRESAWWIEDWKVPSEQKLEHIDSRKRARALEVLERSRELVTADVLAELRALEGEPFFEALEKAVPEVEVRLRSRWRGRDGSQGRGESSGARSDEKRDRRRDG